MKNAGTYEIESSLQIASATFGGSGGNLVCSNVTVADKSKVTNFLSIHGIGMFEIECIATGNNGKIAKLSKTYQIEGTLTSAKNSVLSQSTNPYYQSGVEKLVIPNNYSQYGPYFYAMAGCYKVEYDGANFDSICMQISPYQWRPNRIYYDTLSLNISNNKITYYINIADSLLYRKSSENSEGIEFSLVNKCEHDITINHIRITKSSCPNS